MRVAQVIKSFGGGGAQRAAVNLARGLSEQGVGSRLIAVGSLGQFAETLSPAIGRDSLGIVSKGELLGGAARLREIVRRNEIDVIHVHGSGVLAFVVAAVAVMGSKRPAVHFTWHDSSSVVGGSWLRRSAARWAIRRCHSVSGSSRDVALRLGQACGMSDVPVVPNGVADSGLIGQPGAEPPLVVWAARIVPEKRPEWLIHAAHQARQEKVAGRFVLAGSPLAKNAGYLDVLRESAAGLDGDVVFPGWVERSEQLFETASVGAQTSATEGLSLTLLEQMMAGLAIIATDVGDTACALDDGRCGVLVKRNDEAGFLKAMRELLRDPGRRIELGAAARARALRHYSCKSMAEHAMQFYRKLCP